MDRSKHRRTISLLMAVVVAALSFGAAYTYALSSAAPASADCAGPTIEYEAGEVRVGDAVVVIGRWFGDNCYDTGPPPAGEGTLGVPVRDVEILLVQGEAGLRPAAEGSTEVSLGFVDADQEYFFEFKGRVPDGVSLGEAWIVARFNVDWLAYDMTDQPYIVVGGVAEQVATTEAAKPVAPPESRPPTTSTEPSPPGTVQLTSSSSGNSDGSDSDSDQWQLLVAIGVVALGIGGGLLVVARRRGAH